MKNKLLVLAALVGATVAVADSPTIFGPSQVSKNLQPSLSLDNHLILKNPTAGPSLGTAFTLESAATTPWTAKFPATAGSSGQILSTNGSGTLSWVPQPSSPTGTTGSVLFFDGTGAISQDNANFFWDATNKRLGIGTATPAKTMDINGPFQESETAGRAFTLSTRSAITTFPVPSFRPAQANTTLAFDLMPNGAAAESVGNGFAWMDVCDTDTLAGSPAKTCARVGARSTGMEFGSRSLDGGSSQPVIFTIDGTTDMTLDTTGHLGVGTAPFASARIHAYGNDNPNILAENPSSAGHAILGVKGDSYEYKLGVGGSGNPGSFDVTNKFFVYDDIAGIMRMVLDTAGRVGINTALPTSILDVKGNSALPLTGTMDLDGTTAVTGSGTAFLTELAVGDAIKVNGETRTVAVITDDTDLTTTLAFSGSNTGFPGFTDDDFVDAKTSANNVRLKLTNHGQLGIKTATPSADLDVNGTASIASNLGIAGTGPEKLHIGAGAAITAPSDLFISGAAEFGSSVVIQSFAVVANGLTLNDVGGAGGNVPHSLVRRSNSAATSATCTVTCSANEILTGGGCQNSGTLALQENYPSADDTWSCNFALATGTCTAWAVCAKY